MSSPLIREELVRQDAVRDLVKYRIWLIAFSQVTLIACSYYFSFLLRLDIPLEGASRLLFWETIPIVLVIKLLVFYRFGLLRGWWRYVGMSDIANIGMASFVSSTLIFLLIELMIHFQGYPRSVIPIDMFLSIMLVG